MKYRLFSNSSGTVLQSAYNRSDAEQKESVLFATLTAMLIVMNALDGAMTIFWVATARAVESNPLMALILEVHPALFYGAQMCSGKSGGFIAMAPSREQLSTPLVRAMCAVYGGVLTQHWRMLVSLLA